MRAAAPLDLLVSMYDSPGCAARSSLVADEASPDDIALEASSIPEAALACLLHTSGTGGAPKGVMLSHRAILSNCAGAVVLLAPMRPREET